MELKLVIGLSGTGEWSLTGTSSLSMIVPMEGTGNVFSMSGTSDLRGLLSLHGEWTPYTELSPQSLAAAVWDALSTEFNVPGTMGNKLNSASAAGDPWTADLPGTYPEGSAGFILGTMDAAALADAIMTDPRLLTVAKFLGLK
jgi:hypothetical protein